MAKTSPRSFASSRASARISTAATRPTVAPSPTARPPKSRARKDGEAIDTLQDRLYAEGKRALLVVLQGIDTAGKDGTIRHVFKETGPLGVGRHRLQRPSEEELAHDFLWRAHLACPRRGFIGIFNRSHYEDVLIGRVRKLAPEGRDRGALRADQRLREDPDRERHDDPQVHAAHLQEGAGRAPAGAARRAEEPLEVQPGRPRRPQAVGRVSWRPTS